MVERADGGALVAAGRKARIEAHPNRPRPRPRPRPSCTRLHLN
jgi:hypothetical protein